MLPATGRTARPVTDVAQRSEGLHRDGFGRSMETLDKWYAVQPRRLG